MNVSDSELVAGIMLQEGYRSVSEPEQASAIFVNTCAIREHAEEKVHSRLGIFHRIKRERPEVVIGVLGCMAQSLKEDLLTTKPYVDIILGPDSYRRLPELLNRQMQDQSSIVDTKLSRFEVYDNLFPSRREGINAWISIMRGCDKFCTFCIVPFTRGRERSRSLESIVQETSQAVKDGFVEITLLGQNVNSYRTEEVGFPALLAAVAQVPGVQRVRYTSPHPQDMTPDLLQVMASHDTICPSIHLPLQAGSDRVLKQMNRTYTKAHYLKLVQLIRSILPGAGITTDIIVGFPGETQADFEETLDVMNAVQFDSAYTFKYSPRRGTKAMEYTDHIAERVKQSRLERVISLQKKHTLANNRQVVGRMEEVLVEKESKRSPNQWAGRTRSNKWVIFDKGTASLKETIPILITSASGVSLHGKIVQHLEAA